MDVEFKILDSGLTLLHDQMDVHSTSVGVYIGSGSSQEAEDECGIAHMLEHMAFKGTENRNAEKIAREIEDVGGDINAYTSNCLLYTSPSPRDGLLSRMPSSA